MLTRALFAAKFDFPGHYDPTYLVFEIFGLFKFLQKLHGLPVLLGRYALLLFFQYGLRVVDGRRVIDLHPILVMHVHILKEHEL